MPEELRWMTADEMAETLDNIPMSLYKRLWSITSTAENKTPSDVEAPNERLGNYDDQGPNVWSLLTGEEQAQLRQAVRSSAWLF